MDDRAVLFALLQKMSLKESFIMAIDGRCAAGKTTLAGQLKKVCECNVVHMDDFKNIWIPREERYFDICKIRENSDLVLSDE